MMTSMKGALGVWRITAMDAWDADYFDMEAPAQITLRDDATGELRFGLAQGNVHVRVGAADGVARVEFSWSGVDESDPVSGRG